MRVGEGGGGGVGGVRGGVKREQLTERHCGELRGGLVCKAHSLVYLDAWFESCARLLGPFGPHCDQLRRELVFDNYFAEM